MHVVLFTLIKTTCIFLAQHAANVAARLRYARHKGLFIFSTNEMIKYLFDSVNKTMPFC